MSIALIPTQKQNQKTMDFRVKYKTEVRMM